MPVPHLARIPPLQRFNSLIGAVVHRLDRLRGASLRVSAMASPGLLSLTLFQASLLGLCFAAGYVTAGWWSGERDSAPLARICAQVDYVKSLEEAESREVRDEFRTLVEQCRTALRDLGKDDD